MKKVIDFYIDHLITFFILGALLGGIIAGQMEDGNWIVGAFFGVVIFLVVPFLLIVGGADFGRFGKKGCKNPFPP